jgi:hypothetical protein
MMYLLLNCQLRLKDSGPMARGRDNHRAISITWKYLHGN